MATPCAAVHTRERRGPRACEALNLLGGVRCVGEIVHGDTEALAGTEDVGLGKRWAMSPALRVKLATSA